MTGTKPLLAVAGLSAAGPLATNAAQTVGAFPGTPAPWWLAVVASSVGPIVAFVAWGAVRFVARAIAGRLRARAELKRRLAAARLEAARKTEDPDDDVREAEAAVRAAVEANELIRLAEAIEKEAEKAKK